MDWIFHQLDFSTGNFSTLPGKFLLHTTAAIFGHTFSQLPALNIVEFWVHFLEFSIMTASRVTDLPALLLSTSSGFHTAVSSDSSIMHASATCTWSALRQHKSRTSWQSSFDSTCHYHDYLKVVDQILFVSFRERHAKHLQERPFSVRQPLARYI